jgi:hypothetical protein
LGYFPNGTSGEMYQAKYCFHCVHMLPEYGCPCDTAHLLWNYDECNKDDSILHKMIPIDNKKGFNKKCTFFFKSEKPEETVEFVKSKGQRPKWGQH